MTTGDPARWGFISKARVRTSPGPLCVGSAKGIRLAPHLPALGSGVSCAAVREEKASAYVPGVGPRGRLTPAVGARAVEVFLRRDLAPGTRRLCTMTLTAAGDHVG